MKEERLNMSIRRMVWMYDDAGPNKKHILQVLAELNAMSRREILKIIEAHPEFHRQPKQKLEATPRPLCPHKEKLEPIVVVNDLEKPDFHYGLDAPVTRHDKTRRMHMKKDAGKEVRTPNGTVLQKKKDIQIYLDRQDGMQAKDIAEKHGMSFGTVYAKFRAWGIGARKKKNIGTGQPKTCKKAGTGSGRKRTETNLRPDSADQAQQPDTMDLASVSGACREELSEIDIEIHELSAKIEKLKTRRRSLAKLVEMIGQLGY